MVVKVVDEAATLAAIIYLLDSSCSGARFHRHEDADIEERVQRHVAGDAHRQRSRAQLLAEDDKQVSALVSSEELALFPSIHQSPCAQCSRAGAQTKIKITLRSSTQLGGIALSFLVTALVSHHACTYNDKRDVIARIYSDSES